MRHFSPKQLKEHLEQADAAPLLLDVREPWEHQVCRIEGATLVPMRQIPRAVGELDSERDIVVICHHGVRSRQVGFFLERAGFDNVINLDGGVDAWAREVDPQMPTY
ncbi:MAG: sulfurtransferase [Gammaproteobacteria bacterium]|nr:sulfurtransferase [Gammaproteobacteria bacterium]NIR28892.1 sulfurtransferase [Gammaproteobacteria bacterium]NIR97287.1 sulfurtransferase [Gammaproteobacteria bacterium]NIT62988.1 sulfurtransferase [Gammaproteobacteria bacterium]NIV19946.1 sulfurtransferase [Gammaproteobacteria bacterium]